MLEVIVEKDLSGAGSRGNIRKVDYYGAWRALEDLYEEGKIRAIGIYNFYSDRMVDIASFARIRPMVNQVETHPYNQKIQAKEYMDKYGVQIEAWAPFGEGRGGLFEDAILKEIGAKYGKTTAQVMLRWHIQRGVVVIPKSTHYERMVENIDVFDFTLRLMTFGGEPLLYPEVVCQ